MAGRVRVTSRSIVKASVKRPRIVVALSNLDLLRQGLPFSLVCAYPSPGGGGGAGFHEVAAAFEAKLPSLLDHFFLLALRRPGRVPGQHRLPRCIRRGRRAVVLSLQLDRSIHRDVHAGLQSTGKKKLGPAAALIIISSDRSNCGEGN
jgi:hypothetical protein